MRPGYLTVKHGARLINVPERVRTHRDPKFHKRYFALK